MHAPSWSGALQAQHLMQHKIVKVLCLCSATYSAASECMHAACGVMNGVMLSFPCQLHALGSTMGMQMFMNKPFPAYSNSISMFDSVRCIMTLGFGAQQCMCLACCRQGFRGCPTCVQTIVSSVQDVMSNHIHAWHLHMGSLHMPQVEAAAWETSQLIAP